MELADCCAVELHNLYRSRKVSPVEVTESVFKRIDAVNDSINAFVILDRHQAFESSLASEKRYREGRPLSLLDGVTATVKDMLDVAALPTRKGSRTTSTAPAQIDTPVVSRLRSAGCILIGKTTTTEYGWSGLSSSPLTGITHNPIQHGLTAGGSSAGAAAAARAGMGVLHVGTDGAGSVRLPAHFCGVVGFKPTFGTLPNVPLPNNDGLSHTGPIARRLGDAALMLKTMAGSHHGDPTSLEPTHIDNHRGANGSVPLRIAFSPDFGRLRVDADVAEAVAAALRLIERDMRANIQQLDPPWAPQAEEIIQGYWSTVFRHHLARPDQELAQLDPAFLECVMSGKDMSLSEYVALRGRRLEFAAQVNEWLANFDVFITPTASVSAFNASVTRPPHWPPHNHDWLAWAGFTYPFNLSHSPAISLPIPSKSGLPIGIQLAAPRLCDGALLSVAAQIEATLEASSGWIDS